MNYINSNKWEMPSYERYLKDSNTLNLLLKEKEIINDKKYISVLNTSLFLVVDYFGDRDGFYSKLLNEKEKTVNNSTLKIVKK